MMKKSLWVTSLCLSVSACQTQPTESSSAYSNARAITCHQSADYLYQVAGLTEDGMTREEAVSKVKQDNEQEGAETSPVDVVAMAFSSQKDRSALAQYGTAFQFCIEFDSKSNRRPDINMIATAIDKCLESGSAVDPKSLRACAPLSREMQRLSSE